MQMDRKNALKIWEETFGHAVEASDFSGRKINKSAYGQRSSKFGWVVALLLPKSEGGRETKDNYICLHIDSAAEKGDDFPFFNVCDKKYRLTNENDQGKWVIEEALDSESLAEQEAKIAAAMEKWDILFGSRYSKAKDFCGREIHKSDYGTDSEFAWKTAPYVDSKPMDNKNCYIAHTLSVEEATGKTAFKANGKNYTLNKDSGAYFFKAVEAKPPKKVFDIKNPYDVNARISEIKAANSGADENAMLNVLVIRAVTKAGCSAVDAENIANSVSMILKEGIGEWLSMELSDMADEHGVRYMFFTYRFLTPTPAELEKVFSGAQLLNTYSLMLLNSLGLDEFKIYDYACFVNRTQLRYPMTLLCGFYPQLKALMDSVYGSAYGYYPGENATTLYVSHFIVFNVPSLASMHPENATQYFTEAEMVEHNSFDQEVSGKLFRMLSGESENAAESVCEPDLSEPYIASAPAADYETEESEGTHISDSAETVGCVDAQAPVAEVMPGDTVGDVETEAPAAEAVPDDVVCGIETEASVTDVAETVVCTIPSIATAEFNSDGNDTDTPSDVSENEASIAPVTEQTDENTVINEEADATIVTKNTPQGEQLTMAFPTHADKADSNEGIHEEILTIDLDSLE